MPTSSSSTAGPPCCPAPAAGWASSRPAGAGSSRPARSAPATASPALPVRFSADTALLIDTAIEAWRLTAGRFDPTVLGDVLRAGYDRSFDELDASRVAAAAARCSGEGAATSGSPIDGVRLPPGRHRVRPRRHRQGPGRRPRRRRAHGRRCRPVCASTSAATSRVRGVGPYGGGWTITVEDPWSTSRPSTSASREARSPPRRRARRAGCPTASRATT